MQQPQRITRPIPVLRDRVRASLPPVMVGAQGVSRAFAEDVGVFDLDLAVPRGVTFGLIGPSGSGKTTTMRLMLGLLAPDAGEVQVLGEPPTALAPATRRRIGYLPQRFTLYETLTVAENLAFAASLYGLGFLERRKSMDRVLGLAGRDPGWSG